MNVFGINDVPVVDTPVPDQAAPVGDTVLIIGDFSDIAGDSAATDEDSPVTTDVLANDSFEDPGTAVTAVTQGANGAVIIADGTVTYTPDPGFNGSDSYSYTVTAGGLTETATVSVTVAQLDDTLPANDPPIADDDCFSTPKDTT